MKLGILSCGPNSYSTRRLVEAAQQRGHSVRVLNTLKFAIDLDKGTPNLYYRQKDVLPAIERVGGAPVVIKLIEGTQGIGVLLAETLSNVHRGGVAEAVELSDEYLETAVRAAQILGLRVAGVDMLEGKTGPQIMEVNSSPGLEGIETCTGLDVAGTVIDYISAQFDFPEIDIRQRLTISKGYGVSEIFVPEGSSFVGHSISDTKLCEKYINVLTL